MSAGSFSKKRYSTAAVLVSERAAVFMHTYSLSAWSLNPTTPFLKSMHIQAMCKSLHIQGGCRKWRYGGRCRGCFGNTAPREALQKGKCDDRFRYCWAVDFTDRDFGAIPHPLVLVCVAAYFGARARVLNAHCATSGTAAGRVRNSPTSTSSPVLNAQAFVLMEDVIHRSHHRAPLRGDSRRLPISLYWV